MPQIERNLLFHYLPVLKGFRTNVGDITVYGRRSLDALDSLIRTIKKGYMSTVERLNHSSEKVRLHTSCCGRFSKQTTTLYLSVLEAAKGNSLITIWETRKGQHRRLIISSCDVYYLDFNSNVFGKVAEKLAIEKFCGARQITSLNAFLLSFIQSLKRPRNPLPLAVGSL